MHSYAYLRQLFATLLLVLLTACSSLPALLGSPRIDSGASSVTSGAEEAGVQSACPVTEIVWAKPPEDAAVQDTPGYGYYFINADSSIWAGAWWAGEEEQHLRAGKEGIKTGWFRPAGANLEITGQRLDGEAPPLHAEAGCCYPTRFQASGLYFPTEGCWEVTAKAADSELTFVVWVYPESK